MKKILLLSLITISAMAEFNYSINPINKAMEKAMKKGNTYHEGCPVALVDLRHVTVTYIDREGNDRNGSLVSNATIVNNVVNTFSDLYDAGYRIDHMVTIDKYKGSDYKSIDADNTSMFNCRNATGSKKWSNHAYGLAIDINPIENPYVFRNGKSSHWKSKPFLKRDNNDDMVLTADSNATKIFKNHGFTWGGDWEGVKDYQHFEFKL